MKMNKVLFTICCSLLLLINSANVQAGLLVNGSFEIPDWGTDSDYSIVDQSLVDNWSTTAVDGQIEIWRNAFLGVTSYHGDQHAELNANVTSSLYQDVTGISDGSLLDFFFAHRARDFQGSVGTVLDSMRLTITDLTTSAILYTEDFETGLEWKFYTGNDVAKATGNTLRFEYTALSTASGNNSIGNFLDYVGFGADLPQVEVPEPGSIAIFSLALLGLSLRKSRKNR